MRDCRDRVDFVFVKVDSNPDETALFTPPGFAPALDQVGYSYDVTPDGQRFLFNVTSGALEPTSPITVVLNWTAELKKN